MSEDASIQLMRLAISQNGGDLAGASSDLVTALAMTGHKLLSQNPDQQAQPFADGHAAALGDMLRELGHDVRGETMGDVFARWPTADSARVKATQ